MEVSFTAKWIQIASLLAKRLFGKGPKVGFMKSTTSAKCSMKKNDSLIYNNLYVYGCVYIYLQYRRELLKFHHQGPIYIYYGQTILFSRFEINQALLESRFPSDSRFVFSRCFNHGSSMACFTGASGFGVSC